MKRGSVLLMACLLVAGCAAPKRTLRIALVAPFEGRHAAQGYAAFEPFRAALQNHLRAGGTGGYNISFVAYNDNGDPLLAGRIARNVALDPAVVAVIGHLRTDTTAAAMPVYAAASLAVVGSCGTPPVPPRKSAFAVCNDAPVGLQARLVLAAIERDASEHGNVSRLGVARQLGIFQP